MQGSACRCEWSLDHRLSETLASHVGSGSLTNGLRPLTSFSQNVVYSTCYGNLEFGSHKFVQAMIQTSKSIFVWWPSGMRYGTTDCINGILVH